MLKPFCFKGIERNPFWGEVVAMYQPKVDTRNRLVSGYEALARFKGANGILTYPEPRVSLLSANEHMDLFVVMLFQTLNALTLTGSNNRLLDFSINVPPKIVHERYFNEIVLSIPAEKRKHIKFELLEHHINDFDLLYKSMHKLNKNGFGFCLDDFGSENYPINVIELPGIETLKFDKLMLPRGTPEESSGANNKLRLWATWAHKNGKSTVMEQVETEVEFQRVAGVVRYVQGYFTGKPQLLFQQESIRYEF